MILAKPLIKLVALIQRSEEYLSDIYNLPGTPQYADIKEDKKVKTKVCFNVTMFCDVIHPPFFFCK